MFRRVGLCVLLAVVASDWSCATVSKSMALEPEEYACERDADCQIVDYDVTGGGCCGGNSEEPYAISKATVARHAAAMATKCADAGPCLAWMKTCCCTKRSDWVAICARRVCQRQAVTFFPPSPSCDR